MDAIISAAGTVRADDPELTARPAGARTATRVIFDRTGESITPEGRLIATIDTAPLLICAAESASASDHLRMLQDLGAELHFVNDDENQFDSLLQELGRRQFTNVLVEAGSGLAGAFFDQELIDEVHVFVAPRLIGGTAALTPIGGFGLPEIPQLRSLDRVCVRTFGDDVLIEGRLLQQTER